MEWGTGEEREGRASLFGGIVDSMSEAEGCWPPSMASEENPAARPRPCPPPPRQPAVSPRPAHNGIQSMRESMRHPQSHFPSCSCSSLSPYPILGQPLLQASAPARLRTPPHSQQDRLFPGLWRASQLPNTQASRVLRTQPGPCRASTTGQRSPAPAMVC